MSDQAVLNTDREIWRERHDDNYADSIHVTERGGIGINCGGMVYVKPVREWHKSAATIASLTAEVERLRGALEEIARTAPAVDSVTGKVFEYERNVARTALQSTEGSGEIGEPR